MYRKAWKHVIFISLVTAIVVPVDITALKCVMQSSCHCDLPDKSFYDLSQVSPTSPLKGYQYNHTFSFTPCKDERSTIGINDSAVTGCNQGTGVSLCAQLNKDVPFSLGDTVETKWEISDKESPTLILTHNHTTARIDLLCCSPAIRCPASTITLVGAPLENNFHFHLMSPHACKKEPSSNQNLSLGSVLLILLFVLSGIYLLVGALALKFFRGAIGWELIPNYDFWSALPGLVRDGIAFTFSGCTAYSYDQI